jgi:hypothetical protein
MPFPDNKHHAPTIRSHLIVVAPGFDGAGVRMSTANTVKERQLASTSRLGFAHSIILKQTADEQRNG